MIFWPRLWQRPTLGLRKKHPHKGRWVFMTLEVLWNESIQGSVPQKGRGGQKNLWQLPRPRMTNIADEGKGGGYSPQILAPSPLFILSLCHSHTHFFFTSFYLPLLVPLSHLSGVYLSPLGDNNVLYIHRRCKRFCISSSVCISGARFAILKKVYVFWSSIFVIFSRSIAAVCGDFRSSKFESRSCIFK